MSVRKLYAGKRFVAPRGSVVVFEREKGGEYFFRYEGEPYEGLVMSETMLRILDEADDETVKTRPTLVS